MSLLLADDMPSTQESNMPASPMAPVSPPKSPPPKSPPSQRVVSEGTQQHRQGVEEPQGEQLAPLMLPLLPASPPKLLTGSYTTGAEEAAHLAKAAALVARASATTTRFRLRSKSGADGSGPLVTPKKGARPAPKARAAPGTAGTFCGRRPPKDAKGAAEFAAIRESFYKMREQAKQAKTTETQKQKTEKNLSSSEYLKQMKQHLADLQQKHPGKDGEWYMQEAHNLRRAEASKKEARTGAAEEKGEVEHEKKGERRARKANKKARKGATDEEDEQEEGEKEEDDEKKDEHHDHEAGQGVEVLGDDDFGENEADMKDEIEVAD